MHMQVVVTTSGYSEPDMHVMLMYIQHQELYVVLHTLNQMAANKVDVHTCTSVTEFLSDP